MTMPDADLRARALAVRAHIVRMSGGGGCFIGASLSCTDLIVYLYERILRVCPETLNDPARDLFLLSKGHDVPALYGTLAELGFIDPARLGRHLDPHDHIYWHPNRKIPGIEFHSGSLGHLLSVGIGAALDIQMGGGNNRVFVLLGDGELDEGSIGEAALDASAKGLDNLVAIVDRNQLQANEHTERLIPLEPLEDKFRAFGWSPLTIDGHSFDEMESAFQDLPLRPGRPSVVIARTVRGKGLPSIEGRTDRWFARFSDAEVAGLLAELHGEGATPLVSETLVVR
jgi:transketolase